VPARSGALGVLARSDLARDEREKLRRASERALRREAKFETMDLDERVTLVRDSRAILAANRELYAAVLD
jgi:hypothetical protein